MTAKTKSILLAYIRDCAIVAACYREFRTWTRELFDDLLERNISGHDKVTIEEVRQLTLEELEELGFLGWSKDSSLLLIPIYLIRAFKPDEEVIGIDGKTRKISEAELGVMYGLVAYGFNHPELNTNKEE